MKPEEIIINSLSVMLTSALVSLVINKIREEKKWGLFTHVAISAVSYSVVYGTLVFLYLNILRPSEYWRKWFYPQTVAAEGYWLECKKNVADIPQPYSALKEDVLKYPYALISIRYDKTKEGDFRVEGVTASKDNYIRFKANRVWTEFEKDAFLFTYSADVNASEVSGLTKIAFFDANNSDYSAGTGKYIDDWGFRTDFELVKLSESYKGYDLNDPVQQISFLRNETVKNKLKCVEQRI